MINNYSYYQNQHHFRGSTTNGSTTLGGGAAGYGFRSSSNCDSFYHHNHQHNTHSCPTSQSQIVQELTSLHSLLMQYVQQLKNNKSTTTFNVKYSPPTTTTSAFACDLNFASSRFTCSSYSSEGIGNPLMNTSSYDIRSPIRSSVVGGSQHQQQSPTSTTSSFNSVTEFEERITRLEQLVKQTLSLIFRGEYKQPSNNVQVVDHHSIKQLMSMKIKETYQLDMEPLKQIVASVVQYEPKRCNLGYDIIFQMKTELSFLSQLCK